MCILLVLVVPPMPILLLSRLPPVLIGGDVDTVTPVDGARPMLPICMLMGILEVQEQTNLVIGLATIDSILDCTAEACGSGHC
jgi:hypothetical protein